MPVSCAHQPVLLSEALENLNIKPAGIYIDGTFGRGGHSNAILAGLNKNGRLIAIDKDSEAIKAARKISDPRLTVFEGSFAEIKKLTKKENILGRTDGILLDLGISSPQLDDASRGFSFRSDGPLDMRMDKTSGIPLWRRLEKISQKDLYKIIKTYGEEKFARKISQAIIQENNKNPIKTTVHLAEIIAKAHPAWTHDKHPATKTFQALRIYMNNELKELKTVLPHCLDILNAGGRLAVISFHSLEHRLVKQFIQQEIQGEPALQKLPLRQAQLNPRLRRIKRLIRPCADEIRQNPRARSAHLRIMEKLK